MNGEQKGKKSTYQKIAADAGVSIATVSRILTGTSPVKKETRNKVLETMARLGFDIEEIKASQPRQHNGIILFNIPSLENPFHSRIAYGAIIAARRLNYSVLINEDHINENTISGIINLIDMVHAVGMITASYIPTAVLSRLRDVIPLVQCNEFDNEIKIPYVSIDDIASAKTVMKYLLSLGRSRIALINGPPHYKFSRHRLQGYLESLEKAGIARDPRLIVQLPDLSYDLAYSAVTQLLGTDAQPDAFFCVSDIFAAAVIKSCARMGFNVPGDIVVSGFDNIELASMIHPTLTTVNQPRYQLGFSSSSLLIELLNNPKASVRNIILETELIVRESTSLLPGERKHS